MVQPTQAGMNAKQEFIIALRLAEDELSGISQM